MQVGCAWVTVGGVGCGLLHLPCGVCYHSDAGEVVSVEVAYSLVCAACVGDAEIRVGLQDDLLVGAAEVTGSGHTTVIISPNAN